MVGWLSYLFCLLLLIGEKEEKFGVLLSNNQEGKQAAISEALLQFGPVAMYRAQSHGQQETFYVEV